MRALANATVSRGVLGHAPMTCARPHRGMHVPVGVVGLMAASVEALNRQFGAGVWPRSVGLGAEQSVRVWRGWGSTVQGLKRREEATEMGRRVGLWCVQGGTRPLWKRSLAYDPSGSWATPGRLAVRGPSESGPAQPWLSCMRLFSRPTISSKSSRYPGSSADIRLCRPRSSVSLRLTPIRASEVTTSRA